VQASGRWKSGKAAKGLQVGNLETIMHTRAYREKRSPQKSVARETRQKVVQKPAMKAQNVWPLA